MFKQNGIKTITLKGGERKMKTLSLILVGALLCLGIPSMALAAVSLSVSAAVPSGSSLGPYDLIACNGYNYVTTGDPFTQTACYDKKLSQTGTASLIFGGKNGLGSLLTKFLDGAGNVIPGFAGEAGCFYAGNFYIVYLYPDAFGGVGYQLSQTAVTISSTAFGNAMVMTPVYHEKDSFKYPNGTLVEQGFLDPTKGEVLGSAVLVKSGGPILKAKRARIVRAEYGIPPNPKSGETRPTGWQAIPLATAAGTYAASITITLTQI